MVTKALKIVMAVLASIVGLYPILYFFLDRKFGLLQTKSDALLANVFWNIGFYSHIIPAGIALLIGWIQFSKKIRSKRLAWHRTIGKIYVTAALTGSVAGSYIALYATGGIITSAGFLLLGICWFYVTFRAYRAIRNKDIDTHQNMMIYSYAACLGAVTLRLYLHFLRMAFDFTTSYMIVSWLSWVPNLAVAYYIIHRKNARKNQFSTAPAPLSGH